jgi:hypothetical protein
MGFPAEVCDRVLVRCGRHCCICRRFKPTLLQVHHIQESSKGGEDSEENAIAICINCHSDVHTRRPFTQRFTKGELIGHRELVCSLVASGVLRGDDAAEIDFRSAEFKSRGSSRLADISSLAAKILCAAAEKESEIWLLDHLGGWTFHSGTVVEEGDGNRRKAEIMAAMEELQRLCFVESRYIGHGKAWVLQLRGYHAADILTAQLVLVK